MTSTLARCLMRFASPLLKSVIYPALHHTGGLKRLAPAGGCTVVTYHGVLPAGYSSRDPFLDNNLLSPDTLRSQLRFLRTNYNVIDPEEYRAWILNGQPLAPRSVLITCDDGLLNHLSDMLPILQSEGIRGLFFVTGRSCSDNPGMLWYEELYHFLRSGLLIAADWQLLFEPGTHPDAPLGSHAFWWQAVRSASRMPPQQRDETLQQLRTKCNLPSSEFPDRRYRLLNAREVQQLSQAGMAIGAHSMTHAVLSECSNSESFREINDSKAQLENLLGQSVWAFAYPYGNPPTMGDREVTMAQDAGFDCAFVNVGGGFSEASDRFRLSRAHITADMNIAELEAHMTGFHALLQRAAGRPY
jgi:peptidoglycan/xylan/chitin deacetylase (PgdA/CDA1 family)